MNEIEVALAVSARDWPDRLHTFLADHGGARVRSQVMVAEDVLVESFQVLVIDDICSFLTPRLVEQVRRQGRQVLGVFDPGEAPDGKDRLLECGVDLVIEADADGDEFVIALRTLLLSDQPAPPAPAASPSDAGRAKLVVVGGPSGGTGATEVAVAIADRLARKAPTVLVDVDEVSPAIAQRLGLQLLPNLRTALDALQHRHGSVENSLVRKGSLHVVTGLSGERDWMEVRPSQVTDLLSELGTHFNFVIANCGSHLEQVGFGDAGRFGITRHVIAAADELIVVGLPSPVGVTRLLGWLAKTELLNPHAPRLIIVNRCSSSRYRRSEVQAEIDRVYPGVSVDFVPADHQVEAAGWAGETVTAGAFARSIRRVAEKVVRP
ncbi:MAG TPA: hypothetical protein VJR05_13585 [Acidimicrobiia bacterium]|nr:hypothetical protein [Acidimicrobiia bacterium]